MNDKLIHQIDLAVFVFMGILGLLLAAVIIRTLVSLLNRRDDSRFVKRPPEATNHSEKR
jgi:hypothetical protein